MVPNPPLAEMHYKFQHPLTNCHRRIGIYHGRPVSIPQADVDTELPVDRPELWSSAQQHHFLYIKATLQLNIAIGSIAEEM